MKMTTRNNMFSFALGLLLLAPAPVMADTLQAQVTRNQNPGKVKTFFQKHEGARQATIGAGVGTAAGAVTGLVSGKGIVKGAAIGAGTGASVGLINSSKIMAKHPIMKNVAQGTVAATGLTMSASRGGKNLAKGAAVGAALGLGLGLLKDKLK